MERGAKHISAMLWVMARARQTMGLPVLCLDWRILNLTDSKCWQWAICREVMGFCSCVGGMGWLVGVGGGWFLLGGSSAEGGSVVCLTVGERHQRANRP